MLAPKRMEKKTGGWGESRRKKAGPKACQQGPELLVLEEVKVRFIAQPKVTVKDPDN